LWLKNAHIDRIQVLGLVRICSFFLMTNIMLGVKLSERHENDEGVLNIQ
jgi:hypothetical protein